MLEKDRMREEFKQRLYSYVSRMVRFLNGLSNGVVAREIISQLMRSSTSIGANYFESEAASSKKDYQNFFSYCLKSANETKFWLKVLSNSNLVPKYFTSAREWLFQETKELANIFASSILTMKDRKQNQK